MFARIILVISLHRNVVNVHEKAMKGNGLLKMGAIFGEWKRRGGGIKKRHIRVS